MSLDWLNHKPQRVDGLPGRGWSEAQLHSVGMSQYTGACAVKITTSSSPCENAKATSPFVLQTGE